MATLMIESLRSDEHDASKIHPPTNMNEMKNNLELESGETTDVVFKSIRVAIAGNVDSGKSTLVGVLSSGKLDNGRGSARSGVFNFEHEAISGRTSSVATEILGFDDDGRPLLFDHGNTKKKHALAWQKIVRNSSRRVTLMDLCGHEKYLKTTVYGMTGLLPDYILIAIGANMGVTRMTREHVGIAVSLGVPIFVVVTKVDIAPKHVLKETMDAIKLTLKKARLKPYRAKSLKEMDTALSQISGGVLAPVFLCSNVDGAGIEDLRNFIGRLPPPESATSKLFCPPKSASEASAPWDEIKPLVNECNQPTKIMLDANFNVPGVGVVVSGAITSGVVKENDTLLCGPTRRGDFIPVRIRSIQTYRVPIESAMAGMNASFAITTVNKKDSHFLVFRKGMMLLSHDVKPKCCKEFEADVYILHQQSTIGVGYAPMVHAGVVRQSASIKSIDITRKRVKKQNKKLLAPKRAVDDTAVECNTKNVLRTGDRAKVVFKFLYYGEYLVPGTVILFREGSAKGVGRISKVLHET
jgi:GTPase